MAVFRWWCGEGNEMHAARVLRFGSKCAIHTAFFAKRTEITIDASITTYDRYEKALGVMPRRREGGIGAVCRPRRPANTAARYVRSLAKHVKNGLFNEVPCCTQDRKGGLHFVGYLPIGLASSALKLAPPFSSGSTTSKTQVRRIGPFPH